MHPPVALTRPWPEDADDIAAALADWDVVRWLTTLPWPRPMRTAANAAVHHGRRPSSMKGVNTASSSSATILVILMAGLTAGPAVSL